MDKIVSPVRQEEEGGEARWASDGGRAVLFDRLIPKGRPLYTDPTQAVRIAQAAGGEVIFAGDLLDRHLDREQFLSLDGVHMGPLYHTFMAGLLLRHLARKPTA